MKVKAVLFDLDGVLLDSTNAWWETFNDVLRHYSRKTITRRKFITEVFGEPIEDDIKRYFPEASIKDLESLYCRYFPKHTREVRVFKGAIELLKELKKKKIRTGLVTNTPRKLVKTTLKAKKLEKLLDVVKTPNDVKAGKPNPEMLFKAMEELKVSKKETILVGDTKIDIQAAKKAGIHAIGIGIKGDRTIKDIRDLKSIG
ncbi:MAG: HAD-IA family hydrolase [Candidatus Altiarchaeota archaeon]